MLVCRMKRPLLQLGRNLFDFAHILFFVSVIAQRFQIRLPLILCGNKLCISVLADIALLLLGFLFQLGDLLFVTVNDLVMIGSALLLCLCLFGGQELFVAFTHTVKSGLFLFACL